ncbi:glycoside hydrolase family 13 protein [Haloprofundus salilacus]|uniref:glycoside hydrolase family 13 protein n=1 Tax=Haloprofundus salilacus TaxID=2876190 RepID=UPI001CCCC50D|nr:alpha-glucosidase [Haloprofundus salilacus]
MKETSDATSEDADPPHVDRAWWKESVVYQIYPRSFNDSDGDGVGDIPGIVEKLDYLDALGIDIVWLNPVYESPNADNGYDIADYRSVMDEFGTMDDWEELLEGLHDRNIRLIMDLVVNHTSDEHAWFTKSLDPDSEYRDYYIWRHGRTDVDGFTGHEGPEHEAPPNEWGSFFGGPAWAYDEESEEWYMHLFDRKQPDLNWENPDVRDDVFEMMEWWLEKGIDGFRMDVINLISKPDSVTQHDPPHVYDDFGGTIDGPKVHEYIREMHDRVLSNYDTFTVGEMIGQEMPMEEALRYIGEDGDGLDTLFHFDHVLLDLGENIWDYHDWKLPQLKRVFTRWQNGLYPDGWNSLYLSNHDQPRSVSRFGNDEEYRVESAKLLATVLFTLRGTPYVYQGAEIGMTNFPFDSIDEFRDVETINPVEHAMDIGDVGTFDEIKEGVRANSRDNARTPVQWSDDENAGFTDGEPWINVNPNYEEINVDAARDDPASIWHYYRRLIDVRKSDHVLVYGDYDMHYGEHDRLWTYTRTLGDETALVLHNFADRKTAFELPDYLRESLDDTTAELLVGNYEAADGPPVEHDVDALALRPWESRVYRLD